MAMTFEVCCEMCRGEVKSKNRIGGWISVEPCQTCMESAREAALKRAEKAEAELKALLADLGVAAKGWYEGVPDSVLASQVKLDNICGTIQQVLARMEHSRRCACPHTFAGEHCGYSGAETVCDHTYKRCAELSNTPRFGGSLGEETQ